MSISNGSTEEVVSAEAPLTSRQQHRARLERRLDGVTAQLMTAEKKLSAAESAESHAESLNSPELLSVKLATSQAKVDVEVLEAHVEFLLRKMDEIGWNDFERNRSSARNNYDRSVADSKLRAASRERVIKASFTAPA